MKQYIIGVLTVFWLAGCSPAEKVEDPYLWLEEVEGEKALAWVEEQNADSLGYLEKLATFQPVFDRNLEIYNSDERYASPSLRGDFVYNYWKDATNTRGLWRRTTLDNYVSGEIEWETVLDLDVLAEEEGEDWVWKGSNCLRPEYDRCLLRLSRGGADAVVVREFSTEDQSFTDDGFFVAEAKTRLSWMDKDTVFVGSDFGEGTLTDSGYARTSRLWSRGTPIEEAKEVFAGEQTDVSVSVYRGWDGEEAYDVVNRTPSFFTAKRFLYSEDGNHQEIDIPDDSSFHGLMNGQMLLELKSDWTPADIEYAQGSLLSIDFESFIAGNRDFHVIFVPTDETAIPRGGISWTRDYLILNVLENVTSKLARFEFVDGEW